MLRKAAYAASLLAILLAAVGLQQPPPPPAPATPAEIRISTGRFAQCITELSEPEGYFDTDNFISNETSYLHVIPELHRRVRPGFVYLGVGPDQNFSYIVHTQPSLAIVIDIRRQNMLEHLLYKALFDLSASRAEYLALLFSRERPAVSAPAGASLTTLLRSVRNAPSSALRFRQNLEAVQKQLQAYRLQLDGADLKKIEYVYRTFSEEGLDLRFSSIGRNNALSYPTFESLLLQSDRSGQQQGYLATEASFQWMKKFQAENRLIPIVGDFAGAKAFKAVAAFLKKNGLSVSTFYTSNVEYYLFQNGEWRDYVENVRALPVTDDAVFIRAYFANAGGPHPLAVPGHRSATLVHSLKDFLRDINLGRVRSYWDVVR